ncbi:MULTISPECIES: GerMN domain-containing protein [Clostridium]|jgi:spore germination protein GerM|uniref:GerMN domain-containing protein n=1 Tax=Clostridium TaxID=1485 RepID=UPI000287FB24|nr:MULTISPECIES: GerMN domain-containing protein [Clostridium]MDF2503389.1 sporulation/spore germination protein [Clostridium sp.]
MRKIISSSICVALACSSLMLTSCSVKDKSSINSNSKVENIKLYKEKGQAVDLNLYFDASQNENKAEIGQEERLIQKEELIGELIVNELIKGPGLESKLKPILPKNTKLLSFSINNGTAYISLSNDAKVPMTPVKEEATLKSLTTSLDQLQSIKNVKLQIDNKDTDTLGGNYDISKPFGKDDIDGRRKK